MAILERVGGPEHPDLASLLHNLGGIAHARRDEPAEDDTEGHGVQVNDNETVIEDVPSAT